MKWISLVLIIFLTGCIFTSISGTFGSGKPNVQTTIEVPVKIESK